MCLGWPKFGYSLRMCDPDVHTAVYERFDEVVHDVLSSILAATISDHQWTLAMLPIDHGGAGLRSVAAHSTAAHLSSVADSSTLVKAILTNHFSPRPLDHYINALSEQSGEPLADLEDVSNTTQHSLSTPSIPGSIRISWRLKRICG